MLRRQGGQPLHPLNIPEHILEQQSGSTCQCLLGRQTGSWVPTILQNPPYSADARVCARSIKFEHGYATVSADVRLVQGKCIRPGVFWLEHSWWPSGAFEPTFEPTIDLTFWPLPPCIGIANLITFPLVSNESRRLRLQFGLTFDPRCRCQRLPSGAPGSPASRMQGTPIVTQ